MKKSLSSCILSVALLVASSALPQSQAQANVKLPKVISSHMVLQRDRPLPIWGWADPGEEVAVKLDEATATAKADAHGDWKVVLPAVKADGKAHSMTISGKNKIKLDDILIGDVWIGSGQSNMAMGIAVSEKAKEQIPAANYPQIRLLLVPNVQTGQPAKDVNADWAPCSPKTVAAGGWGGFSAAFFYFGQRLHKELDVPVGLIDSSWGGSPIEPWTVSGKNGGGMYNGMIAPLEPFAIRGAIWYQGESNNPDGMQYRDKMQALIEGCARSGAMISPSTSSRSRPSRATVRQFAWVLGSPGRQLEDPRHRHGRDHRPGAQHRGHPSGQEVRGRQPAGPLGVGEGVWQEGPRLLGASLQVDDGRGQQDPALLRPRRRRAEVA